MAAVAVIGTHAAGMPTAVVTAGAGQVVVSQLLVELAALAVQICTGTLVVTIAGHVVAVQLLPLAAVTTLQLEGFTIALVLIVREQDLPIQLFPDAAVCVTQDAAAIGTEVEIAAGQVTVVHRGEVPVTGTQVPEIPVLGLFTCAAQVVVV